MPVHCALTFLLSLCIQLALFGADINDGAADFDGQKHRPGDLTGKSRQLRKSISVKLRELTTQSLAIPSGAPEIGLSRLREADITSNVSVVIGIVLALLLQKTLQPFILGLST